MKDKTDIESIVLSFPSFFFLFEKGFGVVKFSKRIVTKTEM